jgi:hypothetical protein
MSEYNGYKSWNQWNVSLWINNDEDMYFHARDLVKRHGYKYATRILHAELEGGRTPDGAVYNITSIRAALTDIL